MSNHQDALKQAAQNLREAQAAYIAADRRVEAKLPEVRQENIKALADKNSMYDAFHVMAVQSHEVERLRSAVENFDNEHNRAKQERNQAGDQLDHIAEHLSGEGLSYSMADLERAAVRFNAAQAVLDQLEKGPVQAQRRADAVAWRQAEAKYAELKAAYEAKKVVFETQTEAAKNAEDVWSQIQGERMLCAVNIDACRKALRIAARAFANGKSGDASI
jgi:hypothetical protein